MNRRRDRKWIGVGQRHSGKRQPGANDADESEITGFSVGEVFEQAISDMRAMHDATGFSGVVDIGVTFKSVEMSQDGLLGIVLGNDATQSSIEVKLATRVRVGDAEE